MLTDLGIQREYKFWLQQRIYGVFLLFFTQLAVFPSDYQLEQNGTYCLVSEGKNTNEFLNINDWFKEFYPLPHPQLLSSPSLTTSPLFLVEKISKRSRLLFRNANMIQGAWVLLFSQKPLKESTSLRSSGDVFLSVTHFCTWKSPWTKFSLKIK